MKRSPLARMLPWLLLAVCPPLLGRCGGAVEHSTETGNPPFVQRQKLHVVLRDTGVEVIGDAGAISPGATVRVTNRSTGESAEATARADGSVNIVVPGSSQDEYEVTVSNANGAQTVQVSAQTSDDTSDGEAPGTCTDLRNTLAARIAAGFANVDKTCQRDEECVLFATSSSCYQGCERVIASSSGAQAARAAVVQDIAPLCSEFDNQRCQTPDIGCVGDNPVLVCNGTCTSVDTLGCDDLTARAVARVTTLVNDASRTCSRDDDCVLVEADIRCVASCGDLQSVASSALEGLQYSITETENLYCGAADSLGCPGPLEPSCLLLNVGTPQATCNAGQCQVTYVPSP